MRYFYFLALLAVSATADAQTRYEWVGGSSGDWTEPANWSPEGIPAAADTAVVESSSIVIATLTENTTIAGLEVEGLGAVAGDFDLTITDHLQWEGGGTGFETFRGTGTITLASGATGHMAEGTSRYQMSSGRTLVNDGSILWDGSGTWQGGGRLVNNGELLLAMGEGSITFSDLADAVMNSATGTIRRMGEGGATIGSGLVNDGLIRVEDGILDISSFNSTGTTGTGSIEVLSGAELLLSGRGNSTQASITGETVTVNTFGSRFTVTDTYDVTTTHMLGSGGGLRLDADATISDLVLEAGFLDGSGTLTVTNSLDWSGGRMEGSGTTTLGPSVPLTIGGANVSLSGTRTLRTEGPVTWTGDADFSSGTTTTVFENAGTFTSSGPGERQTNFVTFQNTGTVIHDGGTLRFGGEMNNEGEIRIETGTLQLNANGTDTGRYDIAETGRLEFVFGTRTLTESVSITGIGAVAFPGSPVTNRATWQPGTSPGVLAVDSNWPAMQPEGVLDIEIGGPTPGTDFDQLSVTGTATLGGTLRVTLTDGFEPADGDRFLIIPAASVSGSFDALDLPDGLEAFIDVTDDGAELVIGQPVSNEDDTAEALPTAFALDRAYPNPFAERATLRYAVPEASRVTLAVFDVLGREVVRLVDENRAAGRYEAMLDARSLPSGAYLVRMTADGFAETRRVTLLR